MDEFEANEVILFLSKESQKAENVWGDIYRNKFLKSVKNPPSALTPNHGEEFHSGLNAKKLRNSKLQSSFNPPEIRGKKPSTDEEISAMIPLSVRG